MKPKSACYLILIFFVVGLFACGDSDDEDVSQPTQPTTQTQTPSSDEAAEVQQQEVDFAAEEKAIRELFQSHAVATMKRDVALIMEHWIDKKGFGLVV